jgi:hypothetical protein
MWASVSPDPTAERASCVETLTFSPEGAGLPEKLPLTPPFANKVCQRTYGENDVPNLSDDFALAEFFYQN